MINLQENQYSDLLSTTMYEYSDTMADIITNNNPLLSFLKRKGNYKTYSGGSYIRENLEYAENASVNSYAGSELLSTTQNNTFTVANFLTKQYSASIFINGLEMDANQGKSQIIDLFSSRIKNAYKSLENRISADLYLDGTGNGGKDIGGLALLVSQSPSFGMVGGIDRSFSQAKFWRNQVFRAVADGGAALSSTNILGYLNKIIANATRNADAPNAIIAGKNIYTMLQDALYNNTRYEPQNTNKVNGGFKTIEWQGLEIMNGGGLNSTMNPDIAYILNMDYIKFRPSENQNFSLLKTGGATSFNQDLMGKKIGFFGNMTISNPSLQTVLIN